jgi:hypothetical protein
MGLCHLLAMPVHAGMIRTRDLKRQFRVGDIGTEPVNGWKGTRSWDCSVC